MPTPDSDSSSPPPRRSGRQNAATRAADIERKQKTPQKSKQEKEIQISSDENLMKQPTVTLPRQPRQQKEMLQQAQNAPIGLYDTNYLVHYKW